MDEIKNQILESWRAHNRIMIFTLRNIPDEAFDKILNMRGNKFISRQFAHMYMVRVWRLESSGKKWVKGLVKLKREEEPGKTKLQKCFEKSGKSYEGYISYYLDNPDKIKNFRLKAVPTMGYLISHEAHHRGTIFSRIKQNNFKLPEPLKYGFWDWNHFKDDSA